MEQENNKPKTKTLFVQNLPYTTTNDELEELFSEIGPLKKCFVVANKDKAGCKGVGFITYASEDDSLAALKKSLHLGGRRLLLSLAGEKTADKSKQKKRKHAECENPKESSDKDNGEAATKEEKEKAVDKALPVSKEAAERTVIVCGIKSEKKIAKTAGNPKRIRKIIYSSDADGVRVATILYRGKRDATVALRRFIGQKMNANLLSQEKKGKPSPSKVNPKKSRLIIRNLAFKCEDGDLKKAFEEFGEVVEVNIPKRENGKKMGFGIVQFKTVEAAGKAVEEMNGKSILDRPIAVDWTLPKSKYEKLNQQTETIKTASKEKEKADRKKGKDKKKKENMDDRGESIDEDGGKVSSDDEFSTDDDGSDDEDGSKSVDTDNESDDEEERSDKDNSDEDISDDEDDSEEDDEENSSDSEPKPKQRKLDCKVRKERKPDVDQGRTVFIRNLSFDSMEEDLEHLMAEQFGEVTFCRIVMDKTMEHSKGTAFVQFNTKEQADECIREATSSTDGIVLDGRKLLVALALPKADADELKTSQKKEKVDKRNLHLIRVGMIRPGTKEASGLSKVDLMKRMKVETITRQKLKNPNIFVSSTRLCVRNIPVSVDDRSLMRTFRKASGNPKAKITECRIMRDLDRVGSNGIGKSRGYGFLNFESHEDALSALKATNNNPDIYGESRRLIVEFSLENKAALLAKQRRIERNQAMKEKDGSKVTKFKPKIVPPVDGQKKGLPSHWGPKIRHKARPDLKTTKKQQKVKKTSNTQEQDTASKKKRNRKRTKGNVEITDNLDKLIENYRKNFGSA